MINVLTPNASEGILHSECWLRIQIVAFIQLTAVSSLLQPTSKVAFVSIREYHGSTALSHNTHRTTGNKAANMKVLVTGGSGFIAAHCIDQLLAHGFVNWSRNPLSQTSD